MLDNRKIRTKLIGLVAVPVLALLFIASLGFNQRNDTATRAGKDEKIVEGAAAAAKLANAMQLELAASSAQSLGKMSKAQLAKYQKASDASFAQFKKANDQLTFSQNNETASLAKSNLETFETSVYPGFQRNRTAAEAWASRLTSSSDGAVQPLADYVRSLAATTTTPEVVLPLEQLGALMDFEREDGTFSSLAYGIYTQGNVTDGLNSTSSGTTVVKGEATPMQQLVVTHVSDRDSAENVLNALVGANSAVAKDLSQNANQPASISSALAAWQNQLAVEIQPPTTAIPIGDVTGYVTELGTVANHFTTATRSTLETSRSDAVRAARLFVLFAFLVLLVVIVAAFWITRSVTRRLAKLTDAADRLSHEQLPRLVDSLKNPAEEDVGYLTSSFAEIDVTGSDEIGHLAEAFNRIQGVAVQVATEQAQLLRRGIGDMFVNLARRNQGLLDRQIEFIDQLESAEEDPDQLENLFRLDHLATRMRRNAESLLVLAGAEPNRRRGKPVPLADVVRAAVGEVEDFARIDMLQFDEVLVASNAALDIAHLLSELMENAANFSPPDTRVEVVGHRTKAEGYVISVTDHGIGMTPEALAEFNDLLARPPLVGLALSRSLGFIVIGRLAARFGIAVRLMPSPSSGTTAMVSLPPSLIADQPLKSGGTEALSETASPPGPPVEPAPDAGPKPQAKGAPSQPNKPQPRAGRPGPVPGAPRRARNVAQSPAPPRRTPAAAPSDAPPATEAPAAPTAPVAAAEAPQEAATSSGLTKRVPRSAGGQRAVPGGDGERAATQNRRSPDEVRSMLSRYRSGMQKGRSDDENPEDTPT